MRHLIGIHAVAAAVDSAARRLRHVIVAQGASSQRVRALVEDCRRQGVPVRFEPRATLDRLAGARSHQNVVGVPATSPYAGLERVLDAVSDQSMIVLLDTVQDPRNLGAVARTAEAAGADAIVIPERRAASLSEAASKAAAGALESLAVVRVKNLGRAIEKIKESGYWLYGFDAAGDVSHHEVEYADRCALVLGGEQRGLRRTVADRCDYLVRIPMAGRVSSLNVSVAAGVALFEARRQLTGFHGSPGGA